MARGFTMTYRCYNFTDKNPVIDRMRTVLQKEGYFAKKRRGVLHQLSGVAMATFDGWFEGDTRNPQHATIAATMAAIGYREEFTKVKDINEEKELIAARDWLQMQKDLREKARGSTGKKISSRKRSRR